MPLSGPFSTLAWRRYVANEARGDQLVARNAGHRQSPTSPRTVLRAIALVLNRSREAAAPPGSPRRLAPAINATLLQLQVRAPKKRHVKYVRGATVTTATRPNERWSADFVHYTLANGRQIRVMTLTDDFSRNALAVEAYFSLPTLRVLRLFHLIGWERNLPQTILFDRGPEFTSLAMLKWGAEHQVDLHLSIRGSPRRTKRRNARKRRDEELDLDVGSVK